MEIELTAEQLEYLDRRGQIGYSLERRRRPVRDKMMEDARKKCESMGVYFWNWVGDFRRVRVKNYFINKENNKKLPELYDRMLNPEDEEAVYLLKNITQNDFVMGQGHNLRKSDEKFEKSKKEVFEWLDNVEDPYFFILTPLWFYNTYVFRNGYDCYDDDLTGSTYNNIELAADYAIYKLNNERRTQIICNS